MDIFWENSKKKIDHIKPAKYNPRQKVEGKFAEELSASLNKFSLVAPIVINTNNTIIGGHQRYFLLKEKGTQEIDVRVPSRELTPEEEKELNLRLNKNVGEWDYELLGEFPQDMLEDVGFDAEELDNIFPVEADEKDDEVPEAPETPISKPGDIWILGRHRVMCGDSTKIDDVEKLMGGKKADMVFTSTPYNVGHNLGYKGKKSKYLNSDDNLSEYKKLIVDSTSLAIQYAKEVFINIQLLANNKKDVLLFLSELVEYFKDIFFWKKLQVQPAMAENVANSQVELILMFGQNNNRAWGNMKWRGNFSNYIETKSASGENENAKIHNATFPLALPLKFIEHAYAPKSIVLDIFCGSGTTLIACEKTNRICYGMEIDPKYCDVIVKRWEEYTGKEAEKI